MLPRVLRLQRMARRVVHDDTGVFMRRPLVVIVWLLATAALTALTLWMIFVWVPTEQNLGIVQRAVYIHVPIAWVSMVAIVLVAAAARHRRDAFHAVDFLMDYLKSAAWLWKREKRADGWHWIEPRTQDFADRNRWE